MPLWRYLPYSLVSVARHVRDRLPMRESTEAVFTRVYETDRWGPGQSSGLGSHDTAVVNQYVSLARELLQADLAADKTLVDLGCGDFHIGSQLASACGRYVGVDIVRSVVERNQREYGSERVRFEQRDIVEDALPDGGICIVRQVLQHLSNAQIAAVLPKLDKYRWALVSEHQSDVVKRPNVDKPVNSSTRVYRGSGVVLTAPPFSIPEERVTLVSEIKMPPRGTLRTYVLRPA